MPWPNALPLPKIPAHPRCRCTIRAEYRDEDGKVIRGDVPDVEPKLPADAMGGDQPPYLPPSIGEIEAACATRHARTALEVEPISNRMLGLTDGRVIRYEDAMNGVFDDHGHLEVLGPPPAAPPGGVLAGYENRAKTLSSYQRKVRDMFYTETSTLSAQAASDSIGDLLRYTTIFEPAEYLQGVQTMARRMQDAGFRPIKWKNTWDDPVYRGLNTNWRSPDGTVFEMQFHTPESFQTKEINHTDYEAQRVLPKTDPRYAELDVVMGERTSLVVAPEGVSTLKTPGTFSSQLSGGQITSRLNPWYMQLLQAETKSTTTLVTFFEQAQAELTEFVAYGSLTASDAVFYRQLLDETNRIGKRLDGATGQWISETIPEAYSAGWRTFSSTVVSRAALEALSRDTLSLIMSTTDEIRRGIRGAIAQGLLQGLSGAALRERILATGVGNIPHWPSAAYRAGVIARTETMKALNAGIVAGIESTGATFVRWIASPDEAVCPICAPRHRKVYLLSS